jgi:hypothetical protein
VFDICNLQSALDIKKYEEELNEKKAKIHETVGLSCDVTIDNEMATFDAAITKVRDCLRTTWLV